MEHFRNRKKALQMILVITSIELKNPLGFFALSAQARHVVNQLKQSACLASKTTGFWTKHYTMTLWKSESDMKSFATSGSHLKAMKNNSSIAKEIKTISISTDRFPSWKEAKRLLETGRSFEY